MKKILKLFLLAFAVSFFNHSAMAQSWPVTRAETSSALWPNTNLYDRNTSTVWTSTGHGDPNHQEWLAYWLDGFHPVNAIKLYPRYAGGRVLGFPTAFNVYWSDGSRWNLAQSYANVTMPQAGNYVTLKLPATVNANGIQVVATQLGQDDVGNYYFQIGEVGAAQTDVVATDYFRNPLPGSPILTMVDDAPTSVLVSGVRATMYRVKQPNDETANPGIPVPLARYGGVMRECLKLNPNSTAPDWACYSTYPEDYQSSSSVLASPQMNAVCGAQAKYPALISSCSSGQCVSEIFMLDCQTGYPSLTANRNFNTVKADLNYGGYIDDPDDLSKQGYGGKYYLSGNYNTALETLRQGRVPIVGINIFERPLTGGTYTLKADAEKIINDTVAQYPQLFTSGAMISIVDEPFWTNTGLPAAAVLDAEINALRKGIFLMQRKLPGAKFGLNLAGVLSAQPQMMESVKKILTPTDGMSVSLQWLATDVYVNTFDLTERATALNTANGFANHMKTAPFNTMESWLVVQGFAPYNYTGAVPPSNWPAGLTSDFKSIMRSMGVIGAKYTGVLVWGWNKAAEIDDRFTGKYFPSELQKWYQAPACSGVSLTPSSLPAGGGTAVAQASCSNEILTYAWTVNGNVFGGNTPSISITLTANNSNVALNYNVCFTAINLAHTAPVCTNLVQAAGGAATLPGAPAMSSVVPGNASIKVAFNPGGLGSGSLVNYTATCGSVTVNGNGSPITVTGLTNGTAYTCRVKTTSSVGSSAWSAVSAPVTPTASPTLPAAPAISSVVAGNAAVTVAFNPGALGSGTLVRYTASCGSASVNGSASPIVVTGLTNGTAYTCRVQTTSSVGSGAWSAVSGSVTPTAATLPAAPAISSVVAGNGAITVAFTPGPLGSGNLVNYTATCGSVTVNGNGSPIVVTGLTNGTAYTCRVKTNSIVGSGAWSAVSASVTPTLPPVLPTAPTIGTATSVPGQATVYFTPGSLGSGSLVNYTAACGGVFATGSGSPIIIPNMPSGTPFFCHVKTITSVGASPWSSWTTDPIYP